MLLILFQLVIISVIYLYLSDFVTFVPCLCASTHLMFKSHSSRLNYRVLQVNFMLMFFFNTRYTHSSFNMCHFLPSGVYCNWREITLIRVILKSSK